MDGEIAWIAQILENINFQFIFLIELPFFRGFGHLLFSNDQITQRDQIKIV